MAKLIGGLQAEIIPITEALAYAASNAHRRWGKGFDKAGLNICDTFAYALASERGCPLLFAGNDFGNTDVAKAPS